MQEIGRYRLRIQTLSKICFYNDETCLYHTGGKYYNYVIQI